MDVVDEQALTGLKYIAENTNEILEFIVKDCEKLTGGAGASIGLEQYTYSFEEDEGNIGISFLMFARNHCKVLEIYFFKDVFEYNDDGEEEIGIVKFNCTIVLDMIKNQILPIHSNFEYECTAQDVDDEYDNAVSLLEDELLEFSVDFVESFLPLFKLSRL